MSAKFEDYKIQAARSNHGGVPYAALEEFHDLIVQAPTEAGAVASLRESFGPHVDWMLRNGRPIPEPHSGRAKFQIDPRVWLGNRDTPPPVKPPDQYSRDAAEAIYAQFPEWRDYATIGKVYDDAFIQIQVPCPSKSATGLLVTTNRHQVTAAFDFHDTFQQHFQPADALSFLGRLFDEGISVVSWWDGEDHRLSSGVGPWERPPRPAF